MHFSIFSFFSGKDRRRRTAAVVSRAKMAGTKGHGIPPTFSSVLPSASRSVGPSTAANYLTAVRSFVRFCGGSDVPLSGIDRLTVARYERWLHSRGVCPNTSSCYIRSLRAIYNKVAEARRIRNRHPFDGAFTGNVRTAKRSLTRAELTKLLQTDADSGGAADLARDLFLFSFCAMGMPFADMVHLRRRQVRDGTITYCRRKTRRPVSVRIESNLRAIINRYAGGTSDYLFPVLSKDGNMRSYSSALGWYNRQLKRLASRAGIGTPLTSYTARHTWASLAYAANVSLPVISKALGHTSTQTTLVYIGEINDNRVADANKKLLDSLITLPLRKRCAALCYRLQR